MKERTNTVVLTCSSQTFVTSTWFFSSCNDRKKNKSSCFYWAKRGHCFWNQLQDKTLNIRDVFHSNEDDDKNSSMTVPQQNRRDENTKQPLFGCLKLSKIVKHALVRQRNRQEKKKHIFLRFDISCVIVINGQRRWFDLVLACTGAECGCCVYLEGLGRPGSKVIWVTRAAIVRTLLKWFALVLDEYSARWDFVMTPLGTWPKCAYANLFRLLPMFVGKSSS